MLARKLSCLLVPIVFCVSAVLPGRAQEALSGRFAFADTTLLRDTLGLRFDRLFVLADSLHVLPDTLRALAVRYRFAPLRLVELADSLRQPVDSVGPFLERERFNPLSRRAVNAQSFQYNTSYNIQQTRSSWINRSDYSFSREQLFVNNAVTIQMDRFTGTRTSIRQTRSSTTETGWRITPDHSVGGRAVLTRYDSNDPSSIGRIGETQDEFQLSLRTRQRPRSGMSSELNLFSGLLDLQSSRQEKRGLTGDLNGRFRHDSGKWFVHEVSGRITGNFARTLVPQTSARQTTKDLLGSLSGTLNLFENAPIGLNTTYRYQNSHVSAPDDTGKIRDVRTNTAGLDATLRAKLGAHGVFDVAQNLEVSDQVTALSGPSSRRASRFVANGRYEWLGFAFDSRFQLDFTRAEVPRASQTGGYGEDVTGRTLEGTITRRLFGRLNARANARIGLTGYRYRVIGAYGTPPVSRDQVQQSYRLEGNYEIARDFNTGVTLDVTRGQLVNLPSASTSTNNTQRAYRAEWRWTYRLLRGLTATQRNTLGASYTAYDFVPLNDRLALDYGTTTTLNAALTPRLTVDLTHNSLVQPSGNYTRNVDGLYYFRPADKTRTYSLTSRVSYTPSPALSLSLEPFYRSSGREGTQGGVAATQRQNRTLSFQGNANLNLRAGSKGQVTGSIGRTFFADRSVTFSSGVPQRSPRTESDFWVGTLNFSWRM